jgi:hypothetical protein
MYRSVVLMTLIVSSLFQADVVRAQAPPLCPQGSWPVRAKGASGAPNAQWVCSKSLPSDEPSAASSSDSNSKSHGRRGGMPQ